MQIVSKIFNLCGHDPPTSQTDRRIDRQTTCDSKTALIWLWTVSDSAREHHTARRQGLVAGVCTARCPWLSPIRPLGPGGGTHAVLLETLARVQSTKECAVHHNTADAVGGDGRRRVIALQAYRRVARVHLPGCIRYMSNGTSQPLQPDRQEAHATHCRSCLSTAVAAAVSC